ncbi:MAG: hypothetical protein ACJAV9_000517, partial [Urechidicola sp.]
KAMGIEKILKIILSLILEFQQKEMIKEDTIIHIYLLKDKRELVPTTGVYQ